MELNITTAWLNSFEDDEPMGIMTPADRAELNRRHAESQSATPHKKVKREGKVYRASGQGSATLNGKTCAVSVRQATTRSKKTIVSAEGSSARSTKKRLAKKK